jgi:N-methylhydantoinase B
MGCPPWGLWGGKNGDSGNTFIKEVGGNDFHESKTPRYAGPAGTEIMYTTAGGGGWGKPFERDLEMVLRDVLEGYIDVDHAKIEYGVVIGADGKSIDEAATKQLRAAAAE